MHQVGLGLTVGKTLACKSSNVLLPAIAQATNLCMESGCSESSLRAAGFDEVKTIVVLGSDTALRKAQGTRSLIGADLDVIVGKDSTMVQSDVSETQAIPYSMADGALLDFSVKGMPF